MPLPIHLKFRTSFPQFPGSRFTAFSIHQQLQHKRTDKVIYICVTVTV